MSYVRATMTILVCVILSLGWGPVEAQTTHSQRAAEPPTGPSGNIEDFTRSLIAEAMRLAAETAGEDGGQVIVDVRLEVQRAPSPDEIDVCWEMCDSRECIVACESPVIPLSSDARLQGLLRCIRLWEQREAANTIRERLLISLQLLTANCTEIDWGDLLSNDCGDG